MRIKTTIGVLACLAMMVAMAQVVMAESSTGPISADYQRDTVSVDTPIWDMSSTMSQPIYVRNGGCGAAYDVWAVDENDETRPVVIADGKKVLMGTGVFENVEGQYGLPDGMGIDYGPLRDFTLDAVLYVSSNPLPRVALYDPDPLSDGDDGWDEINLYHGQYPNLDDYSINPFETESFEMVRAEWQMAGSIASGAQIEDLAELYTPTGDLAYDVVILDQGGQANTPDYDSLIGEVEAYLDKGGGVIISAYAFIDWASFIEYYEKPGVQIWFEDDINDQFLNAMFPGVTIDKQRLRVFSGGGWEWRIGDFADNAEVTNAAPSNVQTLYTRGDGLHGFLRFEVPLSYEVEIDVDPNTLNKHSSGRWVTVYIEPEEGCDPREIDASTILMNGVLGPVLDPHYGWVVSEDSYIVDHDMDGLWERMVKFERSRVAEILPLGSTVWVNITGSTYNGTDFAGSDVIRVIDLDKSITLLADMIPDRYASSFLQSRYT